MRPIRLEVLTEDDKQALHKSTLEVLGTIGVKVFDKDLRVKMQKRGASIDKSSGCVRIPEALLKELLDSIPRKFNLVDRSGKQLPVEPGQVHFGSRVLLPKTKDYETGLLRKPTSEDVIKACQIANYYDEIGFVFMAECELQDFPPDFQTNLLLAIQTILLNTQKHIFCLPANCEAMKTWLHLAKAATVSGSLVREPILTVGVSSTTPLQLDEQSAKVLMLAATNGIPILPAPMIAGGMSSPITNAGELVLMNAETLFIIAASQIVNPGNIAFYGGVPGTLDMRTSIISLGSPELPPMTVASLEMGRFYGLPLWSAAKYTDSCEFDVQCGVEKSLAAFAAIAGGTNFLYGCGDLGTITILSHEQIITDLDICLAAQRFTRGVIVDQDRLAVDVIKRVGPGGQFLLDEHTLKYLRTGEQLVPKSYNRLSDRDGAKSQFMKAHVLVESIVAKAKNGPAIIDAAAAERISLAVSERMKEIQAAQ